MNDGIGSESAMRAIWEFVNGVSCDACGSWRSRDFLGKSF